MRNAENNRNETLADEREPFAASVRLYRSSESNGRKKTAKKRPKPLDEKTVRAAKF